MSNRVTLEFDGDADALVREARRAQEATAGVGESAMESSRDIERAGESTQGFGDRMSNLGNTVSGAIDTFGAISDSVQAFADIQDSSRQNAARMERALIDVEQAQQDLNQAVLDGTQSTIDAGQAQLDRNQALIDEKVATEDLATAISEYGVGSSEALQAQQDLDQARQDGIQAVADYDQAIADGNQSLIDARTATVDLADAQHEVDPGPIQGLADSFGRFAPLLSGVVSVIALATAAQWSLNLAFLANPMTWVVVGIVALIAVIVLIATKTRWFQDAWSFAWNGIKGAARGVVDWFGSLPGWFSRVFTGIGNAISAPFRSAFAGIRNLWNSTVGGFGFTVPGWIPFVGGQSFRLPTMHTGGVVGGTQGSETMAILEAGERVIPRGRAGTGGGAEVTFSGNTSDALATVIMGMVRTGQIQIRTA